MSSEHSHIASDILDDIKLLKHSIHLAQLASCNDITMTFQLASSNDISNDTSSIKASVISHCMPAGHQSAGSVTHIYTSYWNDLNNFLEYFLENS
jgi:hypothetical protein